MKYAKIVATIVVLAVAAPTLASAVVINHGKSCQAGSPKHSSKSKC
jgi:hypothetical protein